MHRKSVVVVFVLIGVVVAGCSSQPTEGPQTENVPATISETQTSDSSTSQMPATPTATTTAEESSPEVRALRDELTDRGISVRSLEQSGDQIDLTYGTIETRLDEHSHERAVVVRSYYQVYRTGGSSERLNAQIVDQNGESIGSYHVDSDWLSAYSNGGLTDRELLERVSSTLETSKPSYFQNTSESIRSIPSSGNWLDRSSQ
ncbi:hypothetical protein [Halocatena halophila]|uniref:hypothetical protein n=1 Tax=Halocatena halophila TaxID=2814576 RepID=UPI002ED2A150